MIHLNVPELRFPEFSGEWEEKKINELFEFLPTNSLSRANLNYETGEVKNIHYGDIHTKFQTILDCNTVEIPHINPDVDLNKIKNESFCKNGDLVIADASEDYNDIGKAIELRNVNNQRILAGLHTFLVRDNSGLTFEGYRGYMLLSNDIKLQIKKIATGISVLGISKTNLGELKIKIPSNREQEKIASFLSKVDEKIEKLEKKQELWETYKKGMMHKIFSQELGFKDENGEGYPDWEEKKLDNISKLTSSKRVYLADYTKIGIPFYRGKEISNLRNGEPIEDLLYISEPKYNEFKEKFGAPKKNDILITAVGTLGNVYRVTNNEPFYFKDGNLIWLKNVKENSYFLEYALEYNKKTILNSSIGSTQKALTIVELNKVKINIPSIPEQTKIANLLSAIDKKIEDIEKELEINIEFKKGLLQQMFC